jgi:hypothetical protein
LCRFREGRHVSARPTRYQAELKGKLQNHLTDIRLWQEQNLIDVREMDRLTRAYLVALAAASPIHQLARRFPWETVILRLGGWLVLLSSVLWPAFYWDRIARWERILAVGFPAVAMNLVGWVLLARRSRVNALIYLSTGALLLPLATSVVLVEYQLLNYQQEESRELIQVLELDRPSYDDQGNEIPATTEGLFRPTNLQFATTATVFVVYCLFLLISVRAGVLTIWIGVALYLWVLTLALLGGLMEWLRDEQVRRAVLVFLGFSLLFWPTAMLLRRREGWAFAAPMAYAFFFVPFCVLLDVLAGVGAVEWFHARYDVEDEAINRWLMLNGLVLSAAAWASYRSRIGFVRFWGVLLMLLIPLHFLGPMNLLWDKGGSLARLGDGRLTTYELASLLTAVALVVIGTRLRQHALALPALVGLAVFVFRATYRHFEGELAWPLGLALIGGLAMIAALASLLWRVHRQREAMI